MELIILIVVIALAVALGMAILPFLGWIIGIIVLLWILRGVWSVVESIFSAIAEKLRRKV